MAVLGPQPRVVQGRRGIEDVDLAPDALAAGRKFDVCPSAVPAIVVVIAIDEVGVKRSAGLPVRLCGLGKGQKMGEVRSLPSVEQGSLDPEAGKVARTGKRIVDGV